MVIAAIRSGGPAAYLAEQRQCNVTGVDINEHGIRNARELARAKQLEAIKARFDLLRKKLDELTKLGLAVNIRHNRMVISLPGDVLFDSGLKTLVHGKGSMGGLERPKPFDHRKGPTRV